MYIQAHSIVSIPPPMETNMRERGMGGYEHRHAWTGTQRNTNDEPLKMLEEGNTNMPFQYFID